MLRQNKSLCHVLEGGVIESIASFEGLFASEQSDALSWHVIAQHTVSFEVRLTSCLLDPDNTTLLNAGVHGRASRGRRLIVVDATVFAIFGASIRRYFEAHRVSHEFCVIDAHEQVKTMESVFKVVRAMDNFGVARRREPVVAMGGGVLTDIVGLASSLYRRSTPYVRVPTTLIGMVDAGIGAKTGVNFGDHKNRLGTYHPAVMSLIDPIFLRTLPQRHVRNGLAEILKVALVRDAGLFELLAEHGPRLVAERLQRNRSADDGRAAMAAIRQSIQGMLIELQPNLWENQLQRAVDYGHSFSPTIEMEALPELLHGEAVSVDMALSVVIARRRELITEDEQTRILSIMSSLKLPAWHEICTSPLLQAALDATVRHRDGRQLLPLTNGIGRVCFVDDVTPDELEAALAALQPRGELMSCAAMAGDRHG